MPQKGIGMCFQAPPVKRQKPEMYVICRIVSILPVKGPLHVCTALVNSELATIDSERLQATFVAAS